MACRCYTSGGSQSLTPLIALVRQGILLQRNFVRFDFGRSQHMDITLARGLKDVVLDTTESSFIDGELGILLYRGYSIHDLASKSTFEETTYLLLHGSLPTKAELDA